MQAIILAGGKGERLRPYTNDRPKPMVEIMNVPIMGYQVQWLASQGVRDVVVSCGYRYEVIQDYFGDGQKWGVRMRYAVEEEPLGRGGGLKYAFQHLPPSEELVIATNGDVITNLSLTSMVELHESTGAVATVLLVPYFSQYGIVEVADDGRVLGFQEKPELPYWINGGVYIFSREMARLLPDRGDHENTTFPDLVQQGKLMAYTTRSFWKSVDTVKDMSEITKELERRLMSTFLNGA
ncbi:MAG: nucleotidyltransferase family protein [Chloroflexi bacterium]|nr:nucleotidyltransferase family protein [Chloroflexota bacterium]MBU1750622.1 nucleotidyltransferase family protein [Chloroflexota bacterium]MBU1879970.1 nucleotidyltransferase family protein [Chloroflexota bacterium]